MQSTLADSYERTSSLTISILARSFGARFGAMFSANQARGSVSMSIPIAVFVLASSTHRAATTPVPQKSSRNEVAGCSLNLAKARCTNERSESGDWKVRM